MKKHSVLLVVLALLLVWLPIFTSCQNAAGDDGTGSAVTGYVSPDDDTALPELPRHQAGGQLVNPPGLEVEVKKQADGTTLFEASGDVGTNIANNMVSSDMYSTGFDSTKATQGVSAMVLTGIVDPTKPGTIKQYNEALNLYASVHSNIKNHGTPNVYKEKYYDIPNGDEYYPAALGGFDILLWGGASTKVITLEVTQGGVTKTYIIDYSDTVFQ
ncbi:MAG: hypothetical protein LBC60_02005 [Spirochaetaceae bacterium]|jgi:hypothetical protein|nr:hypothetical protein [Spirochaetaceae bacterium]